jgi:hypothetical protein
MATNPTTPRNTDRWVDYLGAAPVNGANQNCLGPDEKEAMRSAVDKLIAMSQAE